MITDHLGNVRHELEAGRGVKRSTSYYPYGVEWGSSSEIEYAFNGKEKMEAHGFNMYGYGIRFYDQTLARWHSMDPLVEKYYSVSPYAYCLNNPVKYIDPDGMKVFLVHGAWLDKYTWKDENGIFKATKKAF